MTRERLPKITFSAFIFSKKSFIYCVISKHIKILAYSHSHLHIPTPTLTLTLNIVCDLSQMYRNFSINLNLKRKRFGNYWITSCERNRNWSPVSIERSITKDQSVWKKNWSPVSIERSITKNQSVWKKTGDQFFLKDLRLIISLKKSLN